MRRALIQRRTFVTLLGACALSPLTARAQRALPVVGFLGSASAATWHPIAAAMVQGLASVGYVDGKDIVIEFRWANGQDSLLPALAADLVRLKPSVIVATGGPLTVRAALAATKSIPIVFTLGSDPVEHGFVTSLARPGGNLTGVTMSAFLVMEKKLELLHALVPRAAKIGVLLNPNNPLSRTQRREVDAAARTLNRQIYLIEARSERDLDRLDDVIVQERLAGLLIAAAPIFDLNARLISLAARHSIPTMHTWREDVEAGGLLSYGTSIKGAWRQAGIYAGRILKGEKASELPVLLPTKFELVINLKTATALRLSIPDAILARADEVIE